MKRTITSEEHEKEFDEKIKQNDIETQINFYVAKTSGFVISKIIARRKALGLTQKQLAGKIKMKQSQIASIENCDSFPTLSTLLTICFGLDYTKEEISNVISEFSLNDISKYSLESFSNTPSIASVGKKHENKKFNFKIDTKEINYKVVDTTATAFKIKPVIRRTIESKSDGKSYDLCLEAKLNNENGLGFLADVNVVVRMQIIFEEVVKTDQDKKDVLDFIKQSLTLVLFPYLRTTLQMLTTLAQIPPVTLPLIYATSKFDADGYLINN